MGLEGIVSKRLGSRYRSGRSPDWLKVKNPNAPAVMRGAEERIGANATHKKASQNTPGFVAGVAGWLAYYVLQYPFVARRASDVH